MGLCPEVELKAGCRQRKGHYTCTQEGGDWMAQGAFGLSCGWCHCGSMGPLQPNVHEALSSVVRRGSKPFSQGLES